MNLRTVRYSFALSLPRELAAEQLLPSPSLNPVRSALPGSFQIEFRAQCPLKARENEPLEFRVRIMPEAGIEEM